MGSNPIGSPIQVYDCTYEQSNNKGESPGKGIEMLRTLIVSHMVCSAQRVLGRRASAVVVTAELVRDSYSSESWTLTIRKGKTELGQYLCCPGYQGPSPEGDGLVAEAFAWARTLPSDVDGLETRSGF